MVHFVGAGPGAPDLITRRGAALLQKADCIIYAGSLVNPALLGLAKADCAIYNSAEMTLESFSYPLALWTKYSRRFWQAVPIRRIPRQRWCIRPHGRRKKRFAAP